MYVDREIAKDELIKLYFSDDEYMQRIAELAYNGGAYFKDELADWFERKNLPDMAKHWRNKAQLQREQVG